MRFTKKVRVLTSVSKDGKEHWVETIEVDKSSEADTKLFEIENIEDELGIDLITLFKALNNPIYIKENYDGTLIDKTLWCSNCIICGIGEPIIKVDEYGVYPKDYGKTWALTKEELK